MNYQEAVKIAIDRLEEYENTGVSPEEIQQVIDLFNEAYTDTRMKIPEELKSWMERCTWHVRKAAELEKEAERLRRFKAYWDDLAGKGLEISNYHPNGDTEPLYNFYMDALAAMEGKDGGA